jgi:hypothetical protein
VYFFSATLFSDIVYRAACCVKCTASCCVNGIDYSDKSNVLVVASIALPIVVSMA